MRISLTERLIREPTAISISHGRVRYRRQPCQTKTNGVEAVVDGGEYNDVQYIMFKMTWRGSKWRCIFCLSKAKCENTVMDSVTNNVLTIAPIWAVLSKQVTPLTLVAS